MEGEQNFLDKFTAFQSKLIDVDFKREFEELGFDLVIKGGSEAYEYNIYITQDSDVKTVINTGKLTNPDDRRKWIGVTKSHLEEMLEYNKPTLSPDIRLKLYNTLEGFKHLMDENNPLINEMATRKYQLGLIKAINTEERDFWASTYKDGTMIEKLSRMGDYARIATGEEMNIKFNTQIFDPKKPYVTIPGLNNSQLVLSPTADSASGFLGKIVTSRKGYSSALPVSEISKLDPNELKPLMQAIGRANREDCLRVKNLLTPPENCQKNQPAKRENGYRHTPVAA